MAKGSLSGRSGRPLWLSPISHVLVLAALSGLSPFSTDMYISALPAIARDLRTTPALAQATLTAFLVGFALGQLVIGPISDGVGRRRILLAGAAGYTISSLVCAAAQDPYTLIAARAVQGICGAGASIAARAMVGDSTTGVIRSRLFATLGALSSVAPVVAPLTGGAILAFAPWRIIFITLAIIGAVLLLLSALWFPETRATAQARDATLRSSVSRMSDLLRLSPFRHYLIIGCVATIGFFTYIATSTFVFQDQYGFSAGLYTLVFATNASCMIVSTLLFRRLIGVLRENTLYTAGLIACTGGSALVLISAVFSIGPALTWPALTVVTAGWGFVITGATTLTQAIGHRSPGSAAALVGGLQFGLGGLATPLAGLFGGTVLAMGVLMTGFLGIGLTVQLLAGHRGLTAPAVATSP